MISIIFFSDFIQTEDVVNNDRDIQIIEFKFDQYFLGKNQINNIETLIVFINNKVSEYETKNILVKFIMIKTREIILLIDDFLIETPKEIDFYSTYKKYKATYNYLSTFSDSNKLNILVHIRQGDTAILKLFPHIYFGCETRIFPLKIYCYNKNSYRFLRIIQPEEYYQWLVNFRANFAVENYDCLVSSDGYERSVNNFIDFIKLKEIIPFIFVPQIKNFLSQLLNQRLDTIINEYNDKKFNRFQDLSSTRVIVGETDQNLMMLIDGILTADIIIIGTQQRMILRLLSIYVNPDKKPILIVLYKTQKPPNYRGLGFIRENIDIIFFHLLNDDYSQLSMKVNKILAKRISKS